MDGIQQIGSGKGLWCFHEGLTMVVVLLALAAIALRHQHFDFLANQFVAVIAK